MKGFVFIFCMFFLLADLHGQEKKDSTRQQSAVRKAIGRGIALISTAPNDTIKNEWSSSNFEGYANKIVRKIEIDFIGLDRSVYDTTQRVNRTVSR
ncbi:MAG: hypothetical protein IM589_14380, partial [Cytophagales bacterium]|nr:hypothetical protein [Cytophagales bacterium]